MPCMALWPIMTPRCRPGFPTGELEGTRALRESQTGLPSRPADSMFLRRRLAGRPPDELHEGEPERLGSTQKPIANDRSNPATASLQGLLKKLGLSSDALCLLCSGCSLAMLSQQMANKGLSMPQAQIPAWTKYSANFLVSKALEACSWPSAQSAAAQPVEISRQQSMVLTVMGLLDVLGYGLSCVAFAKCGAALTMVLAAASGQLCTALTRLLILRRPLTSRQCLAVVTVSLGLTVRALGGMHGLTSHPSSIDAQTAAGVVLVLLSALSYSLLGVAYEWLVQIAPGRMLTQAQINSRMSIVGVIAASVYQVLYTWPRRHQLIIQPLSSSGVAASHVCLLYVVFGGIFTVHSHLQGRMLGMHGALSVGITNAVRVVVVSILSAALFCRPGSTSQCLTLISGSSAVLVTIGALLWATSPRAPHGQHTPTEPCNIKTNQPHLQELRKAE